MRENAFNLAPLSSFLPAFHSLSLFTARSLVLFPFLFLFSLSLSLILLYDLYLQQLKQLERVKNNGKIL